MQTLSPLITHPKHRLDYHPSLPKIIFFDIDDTLYIKDENRIPDSVAPALSKLKDKGVLIAIATGRSLGIMPDAARDLIDAVGIDLLLTINGQYNTYRGEKFLDYPLSTSHITAIDDALSHAHIGRAVMTHDTIYALHDTPNLRAALGSLHAPFVFSDKAMTAFDAPIYQILAFYGADDAVGARIADSLPDDIKTVRWHETAVDVLDVHASKARAITAVLNKLGIHPSQAAAFGDGLNDREMMALVGTSIAMGNAHPELTAICDIVCPRHDDDGVAAALSALGWI